MHNKASDYAKDVNNTQYADVEFVGGSGQGVNDTVKVDVGTVARKAVLVGDPKHLSSILNLLWNNIKCYGILLLTFRNNIIYNLFPHKQN